MKTFDRKDVYSWANCNELRLATYGYVGNSLSDLTNNIAPDGVVQLLSIDENSAECFIVENKQNNLIKTYHFAFFLPDDKVKEVKEEKKYRPFTFFASFQFTTSHDVGSTICYRKKKEPAIEVVSTVNGFGTDSNNKLLFIEIGVARIEPEALLEYYEWFDGTIWQPFGMLEE